jgi:hypothetical protein
MKDLNEIYLCKDCMVAFEGGGLVLTYKPKKPLSVLLADDKHPCYITLQDNDKAVIRLSPAKQNEWGDIDDRNNGHNCGGVNIDHYYNYGSDMK